MSPKPIVYLPVCETLHPQFSATLYQTEFEERRARGLIIVVSYKTLQMARLLGRQARSVKTSGSLRVRDIGHGFRAVTSARMTSK